MRNKLVNKNYNIHILMHIFSQKLKIIKQCIGCEIVYKEIG